MTSLSTASLWAICLAVGVLPVLVFLLVLVLLDSFKLVKMRTVLCLVGLGGGVALACLPLNPSARERASPEPRTCTTGGA